MTNVILKVPPIFSSDVDTQQSSLLDISIQIYFLHYFLVSTPPLQAALYDANNPEPGVTPDGSTAYTPSSGFTPVAVTLAGDWCCFFRRSKLSVKLMLHKLLSSGCYWHPRGAGA